MRYTFLILIVAFSAFAQETSGNLSGRVTDASGAAIPGAQVLATHSETAATRKALTDNAGAYGFPDLPIGAWEIAVTQTGFKKSVKTGIVLHVSERLAADFTLEVGELTQEVTVTGAVEQVQTESSEQGSVITGEQVRDLQLNGRSFMTLLELIPGVASDMPDRADPNTSASLSINGGRSTGNNFNIDGGNNADLVVGGSALNTFTSVDTIAEFKVLTSTFSAEYGRGGLSQINVVTKGGTRNFHGSLFEFFRNDALDAKDYFSHQTLPLKLNNFGYTLGGPVLFPGYNRDRRKTFFFWTQEFNRFSIRGDAINTTVPTAEERRGDFRALGPGRDGAWGTADDPVIDPRTGLGIPNGVIPQSQINPNAQKILNLYPLPNFKGPGTTNFTSAAPSTQNWREDLIRIDHNFSDTFTIYGRYVQDSAYIRNPYGGSGYTQAYTPFPGLGVTKSDRPGRNLVVNGAINFRPSLFNQFGVTWSRRLFAMEAIAGFADRTQLGIDIPELWPENPGNVIPVVSMTGYGGINAARGGHKQLFTFEASDNLTWIHGRHNIKFGGYYSLGGNREHPFNPNVSGTFSFTTGFTKNPIANLLLGLPEGYSEAEKVIYSDARFGMLEGYVQDDMRATSRLTLNFGLRWSNYFNPYDIYDTLTNFLPERFDIRRAPQLNPSTGQPTPGTGDPLNGIIVAGKDSPYGRRVTTNNTNLLGPRFGFAFDPFGKKKSVIRGGYGIFYTRAMIGTFLNNAFDNPPFQSTVTLIQPNMADLKSGREAPTGIRNLTALGDPLLAPTVQQWSFGVQQELPLHTLLEVSYVGSHSTHLQRPLQINNPAPGEAAAKKVHVNFVRPYHGWGTIQRRETTANGFYNSMQVRVSQRMSKQVNIGIAYTWSKSIDDATSERDATDVPPDSRNAAAERGPSNSDRTHIFTSNFSWNLPNPHLGPVFRGWQLTGIARMWSGRPFDVTMSTDVAGIGATQNQRPNVIADGRGPRTTEQWFNRNAFARPASYTYGNMGRNSLRGPGVNKWDLSLFKNFRVRERYRLQFRSEFFNAFNHPSFTTMGTTLYTTATAIDPNRNNFGVITNTRDARVLQFGLKLYF